MHKKLSSKITGLFQNYRYFSKFTVAVRPGTIVIVPVQYLSLSTLITSHKCQTMKTQRFILRCGQEGQHRD